MKIIRLIIFGLLVVSLITCTSEGGTGPVDPSDNEPGPSDSLRWQQISSVEDLHAAYPERLERVFESIDLQRDGLEQVKQLWESGDTVAAGRQLLEYYEDSEIEKLVARENPVVSDQTDSKAETIIQDIITIQGVTGQIPRLENGHLDWSYTGPNDDMEFAWLYNRHRRTIRSLLEAWYDTGNPKYARYIDTFIKDWIISSWPYPAVKSSTAMWRGLEVTLRIRRNGWRTAFYQLLDTKYLSPATQLLILSSLPEHAHYLRNFHNHEGHNWVTMEMAGLATVGVFWPEFKKSSEWFDYAVSTMTKAIDRQIYPDGVQTELTSGYHRVALNNLSRLVDIANFAQNPLPDSYTNRLEGMWHYLAAIMRPDGHGPLNNDSDRNYYRGNVREAVETYNRLDWEYIASNGQSGTKPARPSFVFPWAGQLISRSDFGADAHWSFFDIGPWGTSHRHNDKLHLSVAAYERDLLVDAGRFAYKGEIADRFRDYAKGSRSHNVVLIDGKGQDGGPPRADEPIPETNYKMTDIFDYASGAFDNFKAEGQATHSRSLLYVRDKFWVVADRITTDRPREIEALWHWHPDVSVQQQEHGIVETDNQHGNLKIIPVGDANWSIDFVKGQEQPVVQGWYSEKMNTYEANTATIYQGQVASDSTFVWVLVPSEGAGPEVETKILSQDADAVNLWVSIPGEGSWEVTVPFANSAEADVEGP